MKYAKLDFNNLPCVLIKEGGDLYKKNFFKVVGVPCGYQKQI